jgi:hypothetical protein
LCLTKKLAGNYPGEVFYFSIAKFTDDWNNEIGLVPERLYELDHRGHGVTSI